jgi:NAD(P) transhydrogenase subunit alpha
MIVGTVKETYPGERRVGIVPGVLPLLAKSGCEALIESGAGAEAGYVDSAFESRGGRIAAGRAEVFRASDVVVQVRGYGANPEHGRGDVEHLRRGQALVATFEPHTALEPIRQVASRGVTLFALELVPRTTRAQGMDVLSSMATLAGYRAVLLAATHLPKMFPMLMTAAGTVSPARVLVLGAGVAGLQAIATSRRLGAVVQAFDPRPAVKEQVLSLGAKFVELELDTAQAEDRGGYAKDMGEAFYRRQRELMTPVVQAHDVLICTAAVPGKRAPVLVTRDMLRGMGPGSVIVDLAAERGGNCEATAPGRTVVEEGVTIVGELNLPATLPFDASQLFARNVANFLAHVVKDGKLQLDQNDEITRGCLVCHGGEIVHPIVREALQPAQAAGRREG